MSIPTAQEGKARKWTKTRFQLVYRHRDSGRYYVRGFRQGKEIRKALKTKSAEVARAQAADVLKEINKPRILSEALLDGKPTAGQAAELTPRYPRAGHLQDGHAQAMAAKVRF